MVLLIISRADPGLCMGSVVTFSEKGGVGWDVGA